MQPTAMLLQSDVTSTVLEVPRECSSILPRQPFPELTIAIFSPRNVVKATFVQVTKEGGITTVLEVFGTDFRFEGIRNVNMKSASMRYQGNGMLVLRIR